MLKSADVCEKIVISHKFDDLRNNTISTYVQPIISLERREVKTRPAKRSTATVAGKPVFNLTFSLNTFIGTELTETYQQKD